MSQPAPDTLERERPAYVDIARLCWELCICERTVEAWVRQSILPAPRMRGGKRLWKWMEVDHKITDDVISIGYTPIAGADQGKGGQSVESVRQAFLTWCRCRSLAGWPQEVDDAAARVHLSLTACAEYPELSVFARELADDVAQLEQAITHAS